MNAFSIKKYFEWPSKWPGGGVDVAQNIEKTRQVVAEIKGKIDQTTAKKEAYQSKEQQLRQKSQELSRIIANSEQKIANYSAKIGDFVAKISEKNTEITTLENSIASIEFSRTRTINAVASIQKSIATINARANALEWENWKNAEISRLRGMALNFARQVANFSQEITKMSIYIQEWKIALEARKSEKKQLEDQKKNEEAQKNAEIARKSSFIEQRTMTELQKNLQHKNVVMSEQYIRDLIKKQKAAVAKQIAETNKKVEENNQKQVEIQEEVAEEVELDFDKIEKTANLIVDDLRANPEGENARDIAKRAYEYEKNGKSFEEAVELAILDKARELTWSGSAKKVADLKAEKDKIIDESKNIFHQTQDLENSSQDRKVDGPQVNINEDGKTGQAIDFKNLNNSINKNQNFSENNGVEWSAAGLVDFALVPGMGQTDEKNAKKSGENSGKINANDEEINWENKKWNRSEEFVSGLKTPINTPLSEINPTPQKPDVKIDNKTAENIKTQTNENPKNNSVKNPENIAPRVISQHENLKRMNNVREQLADVLKGANISLESLKTILSHDAFNAFDNFQLKPSPETFRKFETEVVKQILLGNFVNISADKNSPEWQEFKNLYLTNSDEQGQEKKEFTIKDLELSLNEREYLSFSELNQNIAKGKQEAITIFLYESGAIKLLQVLSKNVNEVYNQDLEDKKNGNFDENRYENGTSIEKKTIQEGNLTTYTERRIMNAEESRNLNEVKNRYASDEDFQKKSKEYLPKISNIANRISERGGFKKSEFQDAYKTHFLNTQSWPQKTISVQNSSVQFSRANVFTGRISSADHARNILSGGGSIPLRTPNDNKNSVEVLLFYKDPSVQKLSMSINGNEITPPENLEEMDRFRYMKFLSDHADHSLIGKILKWPYEEGLKYFEKKFAEKYPTEKLGEYPHHFFEVITNEIAETTGISELKVEWEEQTKELMKKFEDMNFVREIQRKMIESQVIDSAGKIDRKSIFLANQKNAISGEKNEAEKKLDDDLLIT